jgi:hypothetical protein
MATGAARLKKEKTHSGKNKTKTKEGKNSFKENQNQNKTVLDTNRPSHGRSLRADQFVVGPYPQFSTGRLVAHNTECSQ